MDELLSRLESELGRSEDELFRRSPSEFWREVIRPRVARRQTITTHNGELAMALRFPYGMSWRKARGNHWCPLCASVSPWSLIHLLSEIEFFNPQESLDEFRDLVDRGEMDSSSPAISAVVPPEGGGYLLYEFSDHEPLYVTVYLKDERVTCSLEHIMDLSVEEKALLADHMNRLSTMLHWSVCRVGHLHWGLVGPTTLMQMEIGDDDDDVFIETDDDPETPDPSE